MILCLTPNPAIDRTLYANVLRLGEVHRADKVLLAAGGKGLNVARTIHALGGKSFCIGLIGGYTGNLLAELAKQEGLSAHWTRIKNETRTCIILVEHGGDATVINEHGPNVEESECLEFCEDVWNVSLNAGIVCMSGSLPPGFSTDIFHTMLAGLVERKKSVWVDTSGMALDAALRIKGINIKVNAAELGEVLGIEISSPKQAATAGKQCLEHGISSVAVTLGKDGAVLVSESGTWVAHPPNIKVVNSVGSGDAFLGGLAFALDAGNPPEVSLRYGIAAGTVNALYFGGGMVTREEFEGIYKLVKESAV